MIRFLQSLRSETQILLAYLLGGTVILLFGLTLWGFLSARQEMERDDQYDAAVELARQTDTDFQLAISKAKNFAILKDATNRQRTLDYFQKARGDFAQLSGLEQDPEGRKLMDRLGAGLHHVESPLASLTATAKKSDSAEKLYSRYLKDITIGFDDASQAYVAYLEGRIRSLESDSDFKNGMVLLFALLGAFLGLGGMAVSYSIARLYNRALLNEKISEERFRRFADVAKEGILIHDKGIVRDVNQSLLEMTGYSEFELVGRDSTVFLTPESVETVKKLRREGYIDIPYEVTARCKDGKLLPMEARGRDFVSDGKTLRVVSLWDITDRKAADEALRRSEEKFRNLIENSHDIISITAKDRRMTYISPSVKRILGYEPSERIGSGYAEIMHPDDANRMRGEFMKLREQPGASWTLEFRLQHKDGSWRYAESTGTNLLENPAVQGIVYNLRDITERVQAQKALEDRERYFRALIDKSYDVLMVVQPDFTISYVSPSVLRVMGYAPEEITGQKTVQFIDPEDFNRPGRVKVNAAAQTPGLVTSDRVRVRHKDGSWRIVDYTGVSLVDDPAVKGVVITFHDVTEKEKAQEERRQSEERFRSLVESMPDAAMVHDDEKILYANPSAVRMLGAVGEDEILSQPFWMVVPPEFRDTVRARVRAVMEKGTVNELAERKMRRLDGSLIEVLVTSVPFQDRGRRVVLAIFLDITALKEAERKAQRYQRLAVLGEMAAGLAHEIRNPAAAISAQAQYLLKKTEDESRRELLNDIIQQCNRLDTLVHDTLDYSPEKRFEERTEIPARDLFQKALWLAQTQFGPNHSRVQVILDVADGLPPLRVHPTRMDRVLVNLILNAFQAMPEEGGHLVLRAGARENKVLLRVEDDGKGLSEEEIARLFEPFYTSRKMGSGLGLSICQKIVEEHGGQIRVEQLKPQGAAFTIELPLEAGKQER